MSCRRCFRLPHRASAWLAIACLPAFLNSCALFRREPPPKAKMVLYEWQDDGGPGELSVEINLAKQLSTYHRGGRTIGWAFVSTGKEGHETAAGSYKITEKLPLKFSNRYGWIADADGKVTHESARPTTPVPPGQSYFPSPMHHWMRLTSYGVGLHAGEIPRPGVAASHGCIRLPRDFVPLLYDSAKIGTPVKITHGQATHKHPG
jgi:lipoprotein-anchoring transpeptidase ErfK/SrfK